MAFSKTLKIVAKGHWEDTVIGDIHSIGQIVSLAETGKKDNWEEPFRGQDKSQTLTWGTIPSKKSEFDWKNL